MFEELLKRLAVALNDAGLPYMVFGGQAVLLYGEPRLTRDIDVSLGVDTAHAASLLQMIDEMGLRVLVGDVEQFLSQTFVLPVLDPESNIRVDFVFSLTEYERQAIARAKSVLIDDVELRFVSLEDLVVMKTISGRARDLDDILSVIRKNPGYDRAYIERWLQTFDQELDAHFLQTFRKVTTDS